MRPSVRPELVNQPFGDPGLFLDFVFERRALLFDLGDLQALPSRKLLRVTHAFVSHAHMDHFFGFDRLLRVFLERDVRLHLFGPPGISERVGHKLAAYSWNLVHKFPTDLTFVAHEVRPEGGMDLAEFHCQDAFKRRTAGSAAAADGVLLDETNFRVRTAVLEHDIPCLAFAFEEKRHVNVMKDRLLRMGFRVGPWLKELKAAVLREDPDDAPVRVWWRDGGVTHESHVPLGELKAKMMRVVPGQKIVYVTDVRYHEENARKIVELAQDADILFIEAVFLQEDAEIAARKYHLTAAQAGRIAGMAKVKKLVPFHFSPRYTGREESLRREAEEAFAS